jgi:hypothetical protein
MYLVCLVGVNNHLDGEETQLSWAETSRVLVLDDTEENKYLIGRRIETAIYHWLLDLAGAGPRPLRCNSTEWRFLAFLLLLPLVRTHCSAHFTILFEFLTTFYEQYVQYITFITIC